MYINGYKNQEKVYQKLQNHKKCVLSDTYAEIFLAIVIAVVVFGFIA